MKKFNLIICIALLFASGCSKDFESINTNPNSPDQLTSPGLLFPNVIRGSINAHLMNSYNRGSVAADLVAEDYASNFSNWVRADANSYFFWNFYDYIRDLNEVIKIADEQNLPNYKGVAMVLRSWMFQCLTDMYGPIPFRESSNAKLTGIAKPVYEQQDVVYAGILADLEEANSLLGSTGEIVVGDILFNGNTTNWKKLANGLRLRILMRQSGRVDPSAQMKVIVGDASKYPLFTSNLDQAALQYIADRPENESPFYRSGNGGTNTKASKNLVDYLQGMDDPRLLVYTLPTPSSATSGTFEYKGALNGHNTLIDPENYSPTGMMWMSIQYSPDLASTNAPQGIILSYSEVQFILAEAAEKGYIDGGSPAAETYYLNGIKDQFTYYSSRIPANYATSYLNLKPSDVIPPDSYYTQPTVAYGGTANEKLEKIWLQKWLSLYLVGYEAWSEYRRTGFPAIVPGPVSPGYIPSRMVYPADEMRINEKNYQHAVELLGADDLESHVWWDN